MPKAKPKEPEAQTVAAAEAVTETVQRFPLSELHPFEGHPFKVLDDDSMTETVESIRQMGVANPLIVRPDPDGGYEIISGHRRHHAAELAGLDAIPVIVRELDDDAAVIMMVDSNLQRESQSLQDETGGFEAPRPKTRPNIYTSCGEVGRRTGW